MKPLVNKEYILEKYPGKGGWTYAAIPEVLPNPNNPFGWVKVKGTIDGVSIQCKLMPTGTGKLFLPVKAAIRKKINKQHGDMVHITLYPDSKPLAIPEEFQTCLADDPIALKFFNTLSEGEQKYYIDWIYSAKKDETKTARIAKTINRLTRNLKMHDK